MGKEGRDEADEQRAEDAREAAGLPLVHAGDAGIARDVQLVLGERDAPLGLLSLLSGARQLFGVEPGPGPSSRRSGRHHTKIG